jgi:hypothetical protein
MSAKSRGQGLGLEWRSRLYLSRIEIMLLSSSVKPISLFILPGVEAAVWYWIQGLVQHPDLWKFRAEEFWAWV